MNTTAPRTVTSEQILSLLPQTQCRQCGFDGCRSYAQAIARQKAPINRCSVGGREGIRKLADLLGIPTLPLDPGYGQEQPRVAAFIDESNCLACTRCIQVCPVDAIVGAAGMFHTVLSTYCTGCRLCLPACPVDCIGLKNVSGIRTGWAAWSPEQATQARKRAELRESRLQAEKNRMGRSVFPTDNGQPAASVYHDKKAAVLRHILERARTRLKPDNSEP